MNDDSLDKLVSAKVRERETLYPSHLPHPDVLWQSLNERRDRHKTKQRRQRVWRVAATVTIVMMAGYIYFFQGLHRVEVIAVQAAELATLSVNEQNALSYIARYCAEKNSSCSTPVFKELRSDLEESFRKLEEIDKRIRLYGTDAGLVRARARVESHQARVIKTIVQTL